MNPLKRWQASVEAIDSFYTDRAERKAYLETFVPKMLDLLDKWEASGFTSQTFKDVRDLARESPKGLGLWGGRVSEISDKVRPEWDKHIKRCHKELRK
jgi:hypothetical protein